ncbi:MAG: bifunctional precorrin-2 dehydrogenase/sirohydrochlorin ferrochelatase [Deltaproteobacteria bacterium]|nr:bifunctional precorrin-2 dehydrogenase/sirohydrochlorin ferrochelatase [Deltaproteobacteria bacterium]
MKYYPVFLDISDRQCAVVGGGEVAFRKVRRLLQCGARVKVISAKLSPEMEALKNRNEIVHINGRYKADHIADAFIVIGATNSRTVNNRIFRDARAGKVLVNIVDEPERCDFILPSVVERGDLAMAISTGGKSPALARHLRQELEEVYGEEYEIYLDILGQTRAIVLARRQPSDENRKIFEALIHSDLLKRIRERDWDAVKELVREIIDEPIEVNLS